MLEGGCHCGSVRYRVAGEPQHVSFCHCQDCRRTSGAPVVAWSAFPAERFELIAGETTSYNSSPDTWRVFCPRCGTGLYYINEAVLPGLIDIQVATLDDPSSLTPQLHVQVAERLPWMVDIDALPQFERYPG